MKGTVSKCGCEWRPVCSFVENRGFVLSTRVETCPLANPQTTSMGEKERRFQHVQTVIREPVITWYTGRWRYLDRRTGSDGLYL